MLALDAPPPPLTWSVPERVGGAAHFPGLHLALGPEGRTGLAWLAGARVVVATRSGAGAAFREPAPASAPRVGSRPRPRVAIGAGGRMAILWIRVSDRLEGAVGSAATGRLERARTVAPLIGSGHDVAVGSGGTAIAVWPAGGALFSSSHPAGASGWQAPVGVAPGGDRPRVAVDALGHATVVFTRTVGDFRRTVAASSLSPGATAWDAPVDLAPPPVAGSTIGPGAPELDVSSDGPAAAVWTDVAAQREPQVVRAATRAGPGVPWLPAATISPQDRNAFAPTVGADAAGGAVAAWTQAVSGGPRTAPFSAALRAGVWRPATALVATTPRASGVRVATTAAGGAVAAWTQPRGGRRVVVAAVRPTASGAWRGPWVLSRPGDGPLAVEPQVAIGDDGRGLVAWSQGGCHETT